MRSVAGCWIFGFLHDELADEIHRRGWRAGVSPHTPRALFGVPPVDGKEQLAAELEKVEAVDRAVFFEGLDFELAARRAGRVQLIEAMAARGIPTVWLSASEVPGALDRTMSVGSFLRQIAVAMCDLAVPGASSSKDPTHR